MTRYDKLNRLLKAQERLRAIRTMELELGVRELEAAKQASAAAVKGACGEGPAQTAYIVVRSGLLPRTRRAVLLRQAQVQEKMETVLEGASRVTVLANLSRQARQRELRMNEALGLADTLDVISSRHADPEFDG
jgi:hypothetical protein